MSVSSCLRRVQKVSATGTVNVGVSANTINVGTNAVGGTVTIGNGTTGTSNINSKTVTISNGVAGGTTSIYSPAVFLGNGDTGTTTIYSPNTNVGTTLSGTTNLYSPTMNIGVAGGTIALKATTSVTNIEGPTAGSAITIGNNITDGSITIGNSNGNNTVTIGNVGAAVTGTVNVGGKSVTVNIGNTGTVNISGSNLFMGTGAAIVQIGNGSGYSGNIAIGTGGNGRGTITIGTTGTASVSLGSVGASLTLSGTAMAIDGRSSIAIGDNMTSGDVNIASGGSFTGNVYIAGGNNSRIGTANFAAAGTGNVNIGNVAAPLALRGSTTTLSSALTLGAAPTAVGTNTATPLLGQFMTISIATGNNSPTASLQIVSPGIYIVTYRLIGSGTGVLGSYFTSGTSLAGSIVQTQTNEYYSTATSILSVAAGTYNLTSSFFSGALSVTSGTFTFCRIA